MDELSTTAARFAFIHKFAEMFTEHSKFAIAR